MFLKAASRKQAWRRPPGCAAADWQGGMTIIELMIAMAIGLFLIAGTLTLFAGHITSNNALMRTTRLNNELRGVLDMVIRDLRRASYWGNSQTGVWFPNTPGMQVNPFLQVDLGTGSITYRYDVNSDGVLGADESFRIQRNASAGTVELLQLSTSGDVTSTVPMSDADLTNITVLTFARTERATAAATCLKAGATTPPVLYVREIVVTITGALRSDASVTRTLSDSVRVRNDRVEGACPS